MGRGLTLNIVLEVQSEPLMRELIEQGVGHTILPFNSVRKNVARGTLHAARIIEPSFPSKMFLAYAERPPLSRGAAAIKGLLLELARAPCALTGHEMAG
jgi:LysR family nitrogen assimilation transcriptional regulator